MPRDGLHLTVAGYGIVFKIIRDAIEKAYPQLDPRNMLGSMPNWDEYSNTIDVESLVSKYQEAYALQ